jgi:D-sedoheptulose 7-phosphate isomerase
MVTIHEEIETLLANYPDLKPIAEDIQRGCDLLIDCYRGGGKVLVCGNGGSAADCEHLVGELMKGYLTARPLPASQRAALMGAAPTDGAYLADRLQGALPAISLVSQVGLTTAVANDIGPDMIFAQQVYGYGRAGDVLIAISTSGNSRNVLLAAQVARALGLGTLGITGRRGALRELCAVTIGVPHDQTAVIQERHLALYHALCGALERTLFGQA